MTTKQRIGSAAGGAIATAAIPFSAGVMDWKILAGSAAAGAVGGFFGVDTAKWAKRYLPTKKAPPV